MKGQLFHHHSISIYSNILLVIGGQWEGVGGSSSNSSTSTTTSIELMRILGDACSSHWSIFEDIVQLVCPM